MIVFLSAVSLSFLAVSSAADGCDAEAAACSSGGSAMLQKDVGTLQRETHAEVEEDTARSTYAGLYSKRMLQSMKAAMTGSFPARALNLPQTKSLNSQCTLPEGAQWCSATVNGGKRTVAAYSGPDPVSNGICYGGSWEFSALSDLPGFKQEHGKNQTFLDIGANIGWWSVVFADAGYKVLAVEPMPLNREIMQATLCQNPDLAANIELIATALADKSRKQATCEIFSCDCNLGDGILACDGDKERRAEIVENPAFNHVYRASVPSRTLDEEMAMRGSPTIDVVKMDVEGYECKVLQGGKQTFAPHIKYLSIEVRGSTETCVQQPLTNAGFKRLADDGSNMVLTR